MSGTGDDGSQIVVPPSFVALFVPPGRFKPTAPREEIAARHELCEDLAQMLVDHARTRHWELGVNEAEILRRMHAGLRGPDAPVSEAEAAWVVRRLAELLEWPVEDEGS